MKSRGNLFLDMALEYKREYDNCPWWRIFKKQGLYASYESALELAMKYSIEDNKIKS
ncbi:MAG: hypothetical protein H8E55_64280 [Pelagibacterales bacterium]|nr:hypothetical protein [Pelagibacterales bacterium]